MCLWTRVKRFFAVAETLVLVILGNGIAAATAFAQPTENDGNDAKALEPADVLYRKAYGFERLTPEEVEVVRQLREIPERERTMSDHELMQLLADEGPWVGGALGLRYRMRTPEQQETMVIEFKEMARAMPLGPDTKFYRFVSWSTWAFPPDKVIGMARELLIESMAPAGETFFVAIMSDIMLFPGGGGRAYQSLVAKEAEKLYHELDGEHGRPRNQLEREHILTLLGGCGPAGFEVLKTLRWKSPGGIEGIGIISNDESTQLLLDLYGQTEGSENRLAILSTLVSHRLVRYPDDDVVRPFVREELTKFLRARHLDEVRTAGEITGFSHDPFFLTELERVRAAVAKGEPDFYRTDPYLPEQVPDLVADTVKKLDASIERLKTEQAKTATSAPATPAN
ncbi:MAG: hypothetical protein HY706_14320 [Candidatus Hydrogenedentes bacterium]|nr:hypothetical protein [Candidatus Hydrogenedentota bacterium]